MANRIKIRRSGVAGKQPTSLEIGELGLNYADGILYFKVLQNGVEKLFKLVATEAFIPNFGLITDPVTISYDYGLVTAAPILTNDYGALA